MVGVPVTATDQAATPTTPQLTAMVGIAGPLCATFSIRCSTASATLIASHMLGVPAEEAAAQMSDAVGEVCNIVAGYFKAKVGLGDRCMLSVPTVLIGNDYQVRLRSQDVRLELPMVQGREPLWIALDIRPWAGAKLLHHFHRLHHHELSHRSLVQELDAARDLGE
jgi:chemotaxis protein CheX